MHMIAKGKCKESAHMVKINGLHVKFMRKSVDLEGNGKE